LVDSPDTADLIFIAEGFYGDPTSGFVGAQIGRYRSSGNPILGLVMAAAVPAEAYLQFPADGGMLLRAKLWEGSVAWKSNPPNIDQQPAVQPASLANLIAQFADREHQKTDFPPLCAPRILLPSVNGLGAPLANPDFGDPVNSGAMKVKDHAGAEERDSVIRVDVSLVTVPAIVNDATGKHVPDLSAKDFHLFENGVEQRIDRVIPEVAPFNVVLMLDTSGSTVFKHTEIQNAALSFVQALRPEERVMIVSFDSYIYLDSPFTTDRAALRRAILRTDTGAGTRLYDALDMVLSECLNRVQGRKAIVLFTDGMDSQSWLARFGNYQNKVEESDALIYAVQYDTTVITRASQYLNGLCQNSGGKLFMASTISNLAEAFAGIADELQHQYTICYYPSNQKGETPVQQIRVTVDSPNATIRSRTGYRVSGR
jgi:Ca-activated chloride channel homolog